MARDEDFISKIARLGPDIVATAPIAAGVGLTLAGVDLPPNYARLDVDPQVRVEQRLSPSDELWRDFVQPDPFQQLQTVQEVEQRRRRDELPDLAQALREPESAEVRDAEELGLAPDLPALDLVPDDSVDMAPELGDLVGVDLGADLGGPPPDAGPLGGLL